MNNSKRFPMNHNLGVLGILILAGFGMSLRGFSQDAQAPAPAPAPAAQPASAPAGTSEAFVANLTGIVVVARSEDVLQAGIPGVQGVEVKGPQFLQRPDFENLLKKYLNAPLTEASAKEMQVEIIKYCRSIGHSVVDVFYREQEIVNGTIQLAVVEGKVGKVAVKSEGERHFSDSLLLKDLHLKTGEPINQARLDGDINWLNQNTYESLGMFQGSFRDVQTELTPGDNLGEVNVNLLVKDRSPLRPFVGYDDAGIPVVGRDRVFAGIEWANAFGVDQRLNYQFTAATEFSRYQSHVASYVIPLPWHNELTILGAYSKVNPDFSLFGPTYSNLHINNGNLYQVSIRYNITLPQWGAYRHNVTAGFDYKHIDTPLFFGTSTAGLLSTNLIDVDQFTVGYQGYLPDKHGSTALSLQFVDSPGGITSDNSDAAFQAFMANPSAKAGYEYAQVEIRRETTLGGGFSWMLRGMTQFTNSTLIASETFGLGGYSTVRGYDERTVTGDKGWLVQNEIRSPMIVTGNITQQKNARDWLQIVVFCDCGGISQENPTLGQAHNDQLLSVGGGLRYQMADKLRIRVDYGVQQKRNYLNDPGNLTKQSNGEVHVGVELSY